MHSPQDAPSNWNDLAQELAELEMLRESGTSSDVIASEASRLLDELDEFSSLLQTSYGDDFHFVNEEQCHWVTRRVVDFPEELQTEAAPADDRVGTCLGRYQLVSKLGTGGMGTVYSAIHTEIGRRFAVKTIAAARMRNPQSVARFVREMKLVGKLDHPNIVQAFDGGEIDGVQYFVMELVDGIDISTLLKLCNTLPVSDACEVIRQAAEGLQAIHEQGLVHRDLKPSNLMLTRDGQIKILDLGLAQLAQEVREDNELTHTGQLMGTLDYMAPEQSVDARTVDIRSDLYSLGVTLHKLLTGVTPFAQSSHGNLLNKVRAMLDDEVPSIVERLPDLPPELVLLVDRVLARNPDVRPATPLELVRQITPFCADHQLQRIASINRDSSGPFSAGLSTLRTGSALRPIHKWIAAGTVGLIVFLGGLMLGRSDIEESAADSAVAIPAHELSVPPVVPVAPSANAQLPLLQEGYYEILPLAGDRAIEPRMIGSNPLRVVGTSFNSINAAPRAFTWTPETGALEPWKIADPDVTHCFGFANDGQFHVLRSVKENLAWDRDRGLQPLGKIRSFVPQIFCSETNTIVGAVRHQSEFRSLARLKIDPHRYATEQSTLIEVTNAGTIRVLVADDRGETIAGVRSDAGSSREYWIWQDESGLADAPEVFQNGGHILDISSNGRFLAGTSHDKHAVVYDLWTSTRRTISTTPHSLCSWVSSDGELIAGYDLVGAAWIQLPESDRPQSLQDLLEKRYRIPSRYDLSVPFDFTVDGRYLLGRNHRDRSAPMSGWVLETRLLQDDFAERYFLNFPEPVRAPKPPESEVTSSSPATLQSPREPVKSDSKFLTTEKELALWSLISHFAPRSCWERSSVYCSLRTQAVPTSPRLFTIRIEPISR